MNKFRVGLITFASVFVIAIFGSTSAFAFSLPGITPSGSPAFTNNVRVHLNPHGKLKLMAPNSTFSLDTGEEFFVGTRGNYRMTANFTDDGLFIGGNVTLRGKIEQMGISVKTLLMTADLTSANLVDDPYLWGFNTTNIWCSDQLTIECRNKESIYVALASAFSGDFGRNFMTSGIAVTTVPVPAAVWLFGSALGLLMWVRRKATSF